HPDQEDPSLEALTAFDPRLASKLRAPLDPPHGGEQHEGAPARERGDDEENDEVFGHWDRVSTRTLPRQRAVVGPARPSTTRRTLARSRGARNPPGRARSGGTAPLCLFRPRRVVPS